jgi:hypothetical protein
MKNKKGRRLYGSLALSTVLLFMPSIAAANTVVEDNNPVEEQITGEPQQSIVMTSIEPVQQPLAPGDSAIWTVEVTGATTESAEAVSTLYADDGFHADVTVLEVSSGEELGTYSSDELVDAPVIDAFDLAVSKRYEIEFQTDENLPQEHVLKAELTVDAMGESETITIGSPPDLDEPSRHFEGFENPVSSPMHDSRSDPVDGSENPISPGITELERTGFSSIAVLVLALGLVFCGFMMRNGRKSKVG